jgi:hypothetical protein
MDENDIYKSHREDDSTASEANAIKCPHGNYIFTVRECAKCQKHYEKIIIKK